MEKNTITVEQILEAMGMKGNEILMTAHDVNVGTSLSYAQESLDEYEERNYMSIKDIVSDLQSLIEIEDVDAFFKERGFYYDDACNTIYKEEDECRVFFCKCVDLSSAIFRVLI